MVDLAEGDAAHAQGQRLCEVLREPYIVSYNDQAYTVSVGASIGIALYPRHTTDETELIRLADTAMYEVKQQGKDGVRLAIARPVVQSA